MTSNEKKRLIMDSTMRSQAFWDSVDKVQPKSPPLKDIHAWGHGERSRQGKHSHHHSSLREEEKCVQPWNPSLSVTTLNDEAGECAAGSYFSQPQTSVLFIGFYFIFIFFKSKAVIYVTCTSHIFSDLNILHKVFTLMKWSGLPFIN